MLKLLSKNEIAKAKSEERAREIAEGLKISRKVDSLRELQADEERNLFKWRDQTLKAIGDEIDKLLRKKEKLEAEIKELEWHINKTKMETS